MFIFVKCFEECFCQIITIKEMRVITGTNFKNVQKERSFMRYCSDGCVCFSKMRYVYYV